MLALIESPQVHGNGAKPVPKSRHQHGLLTPEGPPVPEDARITADKRTECVRCTAESYFGPSYRDFGGGRTRCLSIQTSVRRRIAGRF